MRLNFLGSGNFFTTLNFHSNMLLEFSDGQRMLIDAGTDIRRSLSAQGYGFNDFNSVYISHLHGDHAGGIETLAYAAEFITHKKYDLYIHKSLITGLNSLLLPALTGLFPYAGLDRFFNLHLVDDCFYAPSQVKNRIQMIRSPHSNCMDSFGLFFRNTYLTTDVNAFNLSVNKEYYEKASLIFHDCSINSSEVHANFDDLICLPEDIRKKIWFYHFEDKPEDYLGIDWKMFHFRGFVPQNGIFEI